MILLSPFPLLIGNVRIADYKKKTKRFMFVLLFWPNLQNFACQMNFKLKFTSGEHHLSFIFIRQERRDLRIVYQILRSHNSSSYHVLSIYHRQPFIPHCNPGRQRLLLPFYKCGLRSGAVTCLRPYRFLVKELGFSPKFTCLQILSSTTKCYCIFCLRTIRI